MVCPLDPKLIPTRVGIDLQSRAEHLAENHYSYGNQREWKVGAGSGEKGQGFPTILWSRALNI